MMNAENILPTHTVMLTYFTKINVCGASLCFKNPFKFCFFQAIKSRLWAKQKTSKKLKNEASKEEKTAKPQTPAAAVCAIPQLTEAERMRQSPFERLVYDMAHNERIVNDLMLGRRVGFYELRGEIGQGNFSAVRLGIHALTKGMRSWHSCSFISLIHQSVMFLFKIFTNAESRVLHMSKLPV